jgi:hypothetical protein
VYVCLTGNILFCTCSYSYNPTTMKNWNILLLRRGQFGEFLEMINQALILPNSFSYSVHQCVQNIHNGNRGDSKLCL